MIIQWVHHILSIEACDAIRRELNCFISMINSVATLCGFAPLTTSEYLRSSHILGLLSFYYMPKLFHNYPPTPANKQTNKLGWAQVVLTCVPRRSL